MTDIDSIIFVYLVPASFWVLMEVLYWLTVEDEWDD